MYNFVNCILEVELKAQSPMIHFQAFEHGATLRASEVKPKFDRFILSKMYQKEGEENEKFKEFIIRMRKKYANFEVFVSDDKNSLNYKMKIFVNKIENPFERNKNEYTSYFGSEHLLITNPTVRIVCFSKYLQAYIEEYIEEFFLVSNFGTRQGKGFGGFVFANYNVNLVANEIQKIANYLKTNYNSSSCYYMKVGNNTSSFVPLFQAISHFYSFLKTGDVTKKQEPYIYTYAKQKGMKNEKEWALWANEGIGKMDSSELTYVKSMLGVAGKIDFRHVNVKYSVVISSNNIKRFSSPIFFKIIGDYVFIVVKPIPKLVFGELFKFSKRSKLNGFIRVKDALISTPKIEEFDLNDFMDKGVKEYNRQKNVEFVKKVV